MFAQTEEATTKSGKKVILFADGTWKYADDMKPAETKPAPDKPKQSIKEKQDNRTAIPEGCDDIFDISEEKKSGLTTISTKNMIIVAEDNSGKEIDILLQRNSKGIITIIIKPIGAGDCIGEGNMVSFSFENGSKTDLSHDGSPNCKNEITISLGGSFGKKKQLEELAAKKVKSIKAWTQKGIVQQTLSAENQEQFMRAINCLTRK